MKRILSAAVLITLWLSMAFLLPSGGWSKAEAETAVPASAPTLRVGDTLAFGSYEQDNEVSNGREVVLWRVLAVEGDKALLISEMCLDSQPYHEPGESITWETSTLRAWLNGEFLTALFTAEEQGAILTVALKNEDNVRNYTVGGNDTADKVFLLSIAEAELLFSGDEDRQAMITSYASAQGAYDRDGYGVWWLRSPGYGTDYAASVRTKGTIDEDGYNAYHKAYAVRPALYVNPGSGIF